MRRTNQDTPIQQFTQATWSGGINTAVPPDLLSDNEAVDILNLEFNNDDELVTRNGVSALDMDVFTFTKRITSIHYYENQIGDVHVLFTNEDKLYEQLTTGPVDITGALTFPNNTFWQWVNYAGMAIGVNKATSGDNPIKVNGGPLVAALGGSPPKGKYIEIWNERVWIVSATDPNTIQCSALGSPEVWTTGGGAADGGIFDIGKDDGDQITGLIAFRERLFIFKRTKIYVATATSTPITDLNNIRFDIFATNIGAISAYSIKPVLNDVLFLSDSGVASLVNTEVAGDFQAALVSRNVKEIRQIKKSATFGGDFFSSQEISAYVIPESDQYVLLVPKELSVREVFEMYVFDYRRLQDQIIRWVRFDGRVSGTVMTAVYDAGNRLYWIGGYDPVDGFYKLYQYVPKPELYSYREDVYAYSKVLETKAYDFNTPLLRKLFHKFGQAIHALSGTVNVIVHYFFNENVVVGDTYSLTFNSGVNNAVWDVAIFDTDRFAADVQSTFRYWRLFKHNDFGRKAVNVTFNISNSVIDQAFGVKNLSVGFAVLNENKVSDV